MIRTMIVALGLVTASVVVMADDFSADDFGADADAEIAPAVIETIENGKTDLFQMSSHIIATDDIDDAPLNVTETNGEAGTGQIASLN